MGGCIKKKKFTAELNIVIYTYCGLRFGVFIYRKLQCNSIGSTKRFQKPSRQFRLIVIMILFL